MSDRVNYSLSLALLNISMDKINPDYYKQGDIECIDAIKSSMSHTEFCAYLKGSIMKYLWRYKQKNGIEDIKKSLWYLKKLKIAEANNDK